MMEVQRKVSKVIVTEEGLFHYGEIPADYTGAQLTVEVCHAIMFSDERGNFQTFTLYAPPAKDHLRNVKAYNPSQMTTTIPPTAADFGTESTYTHRFPAEVKSLVDGHVALVESDGKSKAMP